MIDTSVVRTPNTVAVKTTQAVWTYVHPPGQMSAYVISSKLEEVAMTPDTRDLACLAEAPFRQQVTVLRELFGFNKKEFAELLGVNEKTIRRWEQDAETHPQDSHKQAIEALRTMAESLGDLFEPDMIKVWVDRPNPALQGDRPRDYARRPGGIFVMAHLLGNLGR